MSYSLTGAGEEDMKRELRVLDELADEIDQLASTAKHCETVAPEVETFLDYAWYFAEKGIRESRGCCSTGCGNARNCMCCRHFNELKPKAESAWRRL